MRKVNLSGKDKIFSFEYVGIGTYEIPRKLWILFIPIYITMDLKVEIKAIEINCAEPREKKDLKVKGMISIIKSREVS